MKKSTYFLLFAFFWSAISIAQINFASKVVIGTTAEDPLVIASAKINGDNFIDIVLITFNATTGNTIEVYFNDLANSDNFIKQSNVTNTLISIAGLALADVDGDGAIDIIATGSNKLAWYKNNGSGSFGAEQIISSTLGGGSTIVTGLIDNNSSIDIAIADFASNSTLWFANDGSGNFGSANTISSVADSGPSDIDIADFDGDGDLDVVVGNRGFGTVELYDNKLVQNGSVSFVKYDNTVSTTNSTFLYDVGFGDVNDDNILDIVKADVGSPGDATYYIRNDNTLSTTFVETEFSTSISRVATVTVADFNNDTYNDVMITNANIDANPDIVILESNVDGTFKPETIIDDSNSQFFNTTINDFDNDGDIDIATAAFPRNRADYILNNTIVLGIEDYAIEGVKIYPNPSFDKLTFKGINDLNKSISIFNNVGQKVIETLIDINNQIDVSNLARGLYLLKIEGTDGVHKMVKN